MKKLLVSFALVAGLVALASCGSQEPGAPPGPTVTGISPEIGPAAGGTEVTVTGTNFTPDTMVTLADTALEGLTYVDEQTMKGTTPAALGGTQAGVLVSNANGLSFVLDVFYYIPQPKIVSVTPNSGKPDGLVPIAITGSGFMDFDAGPNTVTVGGEPALDVVTLSDATIECTVPPGSGPATIIVTNVNGTAKKASGYRYFPPPTVAFLTPAEGTPLGKTMVTITGTGFTMNSPGSPEVSFGGSAATMVTTVNDTTITCMTPPRDGVADVSVTNGNGVGTLTDGFWFYPRPTLTGVSPDEGSQAGGETLTLTGSGFLDNFAGTPTVQIGGVDAVGVTVDSDTQITCDTPETGLGSQTISVANANGTATLSGAYTALLNALLASDGPKLYKVDLSDASTSEIGSIGYTILGMAFHPNRTLYAVTGSQLITIDPGTGAGTVVASLSATPGFADLAFVGTRLFGADNSTGTVYEIGIPSGTVTKKASFPVSSNNYSGFRCGLGSDGTNLYFMPGPYSQYGGASGASNIMRIVPDSGGYSSLGGVSSTHAVRAMGYFGGSLYIVDRAQYAYNNQSNQHLMRLSSDLGSATDLGSLGMDLIAGTP